MSRSQDRKSHFKGLPPIVVAAVALTIFLVMNTAEVALRSRGAHQRPRNQSGNSAAMNEASSAILLDSIVSLVQNYYVDVDRVSGDRLVAGAMRSLAYAIPELRFEENESTYALSFKSERIEFPREGDMAYEVVLGQLKSLIGFCERIDISQLMDQGENIMLGTERDSSTIVLNALLSSLDAHSALMSADDYQELRQGTEGAFGGLGVVVGVRDSVLTVLKPLPKSPASRMGVKKNDKILSIDGFATYGLTLDKLITHMRGEPGTSAQLVTLRAGDWSPREIEVRREVIEVDSVEAFEYHNENSHVLRLAIENFASRTSKEVLTHLRKFRKKYPVSGVILDLRGNPGGLLDQAILVSDIFLDKGIVVTTRGRREEIERASHSFEEGDYPLAILMNEDSASASEIVAGALQDNGRAIVIGQPSFGKGSVQTVFELPEMRALKLTIARYFTPADKSIQNVGIMPDIWIQPIYRSESNSNLLGDYRYRNEQFLPNHLSAVASSSASGPRLKGYFLSPGPKYSDESQKFADPEMSLAMSIFKAVSTTYGTGLPEGARRSSHWLALGMPVIRQKLNDLSGEAMSWLQRKHSLRWTAQTSGENGSSPLALHIKSSAAGLKAIAGGSVNVPWKVTNLGSVPVENVSVFIQSPVSGLETKEVLVGAVGAGQSKEGILKVLTPVSMATGRHYVNAGIAVDAVALSNAQGEFLLDVVERPRADLTATAEFVDGKPGVEAGVLEPLERAALRVLVTNRSEHDAVDARLSAVNLGGGQIGFPRSDYLVGTIKSGEKKEVLIPIAAREKLASRSVLFGISVKRESARESYFTFCEVLTRGARSAAREAVTLSH